MSDNTGTKREALLRVANLVKPALASQPYIPALTHIRFDGKHATAYDDVSAIRVRCDLQARRLVPGELLIKALGSFAGETVALQEGKEGTIVLKSGRSTVKLPTLGLDAFPLELPEVDSDAVVFLDGMIMAGISRCLMSVGTDATLPAQMGVTLDVDEDGHAVLYSTDNYTISRCATKSKIKLPGDAPVILPTFFCEQLVRLAAAFKEDEIDLCLHAGALRADVGAHAVVFSKTLVETEPLNFPRIFDKNCRLSELKDRLAPIPEGLDSALERALMVLSGERSMSTSVTPGEGKFAMRSESAMGDADDHLTYKGHDDCEPFCVDPGLWARGIKAATRMAFLPRVVALADDAGAFAHLIAHVSK